MNEVEPPVSIHIKKISVFQNVMQVIGLWVEILTGFGIVIKQIMPEIIIVIHPLFTVFITQAIGYRLVNCTDLISIGNLPGRKFNVFPFGFFVFFSMLANAVLYLCIGPNLRLGS